MGLRCEQHVEDGYSYNRFTDTQMRPIFRQCKYNAKYKVKAENTKGYVSEMNVCTKHKNNLIKRFKIIDIQII